MLDDIQIDKRGLHRRVGAGVRRLNKRVYIPTAIFTPYPTDTDPVDTPATTSQPVVSQTPVLPNPVTTSSSNPLVNLPTQPGTSSPNPLTSPTPAAPVTSSSSTPATPSAQSTQARVTSPVQQSTASRTVADPVTEVTQTLTSTRSVIGAAAASISPSPSPSAAATTSSNVSTGVIIGGIVAAVIGIAGIVFAVVYFVRRSRRNAEEDDGNDFNAQAFRRQSVAIQEDNTPAMSRAMTLNRGGGNTPRPPTMIERKMAQTPVSYNTAPVSHPYGYAAAYNQPSFSPGQIITPGPYTPTTANSANPFFSPFETPMHSPISPAHHDYGYDAQGSPITRQPSSGSTAVLSRQPSSAAQPVPQNASEGEYVDLSRSSVTPFQAAQYAEISRRLNTTPPQALPASEVAEVAEELSQQNEPAPMSPQRPVEPLELQPSISFDGPQHLTVQPTPKESAFPESPFADPTLSMHEEQLQHAPERESLNIPQPPSPAFSSKSRIASTPPTLPEIQICQRPFSPVSLDFPLVPSTPLAAPSPLGSSFTAPSPPPSAHLAETPVPVAAPAPALREQATARVPAAQRPDTVYTLYDEEDAYAGI
ncbi:hypothetical protein BN946_scf184851.g81 [Trametes cinnabarina]|uniref:Uncharacterized protein n=1 Tax=Pycnoporus cinnabarinus TaxID=5643 RepID=A0A060SBD2_PYCCI|nr:hypothetical protein BN946_scf184851.g81 [Trametes cinnabarina]